MRIVGLDFETANHQPGSICSVGVASFEDGELAETREWLVKPHSSCDFFFDRFVDIHGISYHDVRQSPQFPEIWPLLRSRLDSADLVVAHNSAFDMRVLDGILALYDLPRPKFDIFCTLKASRRVWPRLSSHNLAAMARHLNLVLNHHDALSDAETAGRILLEIQNIYGRQSIPELAARCHLKLGRFSSDGWENCACI